MKNYFFAVLMILSSLLSCTRNFEPLTQPTEPFLPEPPRQLIPLAVGNYWIYEETYKDADTSYSQSIRTKIICWEKTGGYNWAHLVTPRTGWDEDRFLMVENDSIYELQYNWSNPVRSLQYIIPTDSMEYFRSLLGGDVFVYRKVCRLDTTIQTPVGDFSNILMFEFWCPDYTYQELLTRGIGIIETRYINQPFLGHKPFKIIAKLIDARIEKNTSR